MRGDDYGTHRVIEPAGALPQAAWRVDNDVDKRFDSELLLDVERLNIDSASFVQMEGTGSEAERAERARQTIRDTVDKRGKQHNPVTGSGGMLLGRVARVGSAFPSPPTVGERIATLVSLTLTPLRLESIGAVNVHRHQVEVSGQAVLFASGAWARMPGDLPESVALAAFDVAGAAPQVERLAQPGMRILILGCGGKSGLLCAAAGRARGAHVVGVERSVDAAGGARRLGACAEIVIANAADPVATQKALGGATFDLTVSCVNVENAEMTAILSTRPQGTIYFFSMSTQFARAALGAEGVSRDVNMLVGNGYCEHHAEKTMALLASEPVLRQIFVERFSD